MNNTKTNEYVVEEIQENYENFHIEEVKKIISINKANNKLSRDFIIKSQKYTAEDKIIYLDILDNINSVNRKAKIKTTNYDGKVYALLFIEEFSAFLRNPENNFTAREMKLLLAIYEIITKANAISNCLLSCDKKYLAKVAGIDFTNIGKIIKSLEKKNILKVDENNSIFLNYQYFFMGNSMNYDMYKNKYDNIE